MFLQVASLPRRLKMLIMLLCDVFLLPLALYSAIALRMGSTAIDVQTYFWLFPLVPFITVPIFIRLGLYRAIIRYMDDKIIFTILYGVSLSVLLLLAAVVMGQVSGLPRSSIIIYWVIAVAYITSSRFIARGLLRTLEYREDKREKVAIYGAGRSGLQTAKALLSGAEFTPVAFFDDSEELHGRMIAGIRVYDPKDAQQIMDSFGCTQLLIAMPSASRSRRKEIINRFEHSNFTLKTLPGMGELVDGKVRIEDIREVGVEDLLGRDPVPPIEDLMDSCIKGKVVMVTGAGGSIGSELCRQILSRAPKKVVLYEVSEFSLYKLGQELEKYGGSTVLVPVLGNVLEASQLISTIRSHGVETIYHAAAYKHVPLVEQNEIPAILNNVYGTLITSRAAIEGNVDTFVLISTDKAVRPTNLMGATKRLAELILQAQSQDKSHKTRFCMVRFGNVLGSSGSVVPLFKEQIKHDGPVTVTHPEITRYFMTIPEAAQLVLQAGSMGIGGDVYVLDMGESVKILDLAKKMIVLSGFEVKDPITGKGDISIEFTGLRPGEKLYEELLIGDDVLATQHPRIMTAQEASVPLDILIQYLDNLHFICKNGDRLAAREAVQKLLPEYKPSSQK